MSDQSEQPSPLADLGSLRATIDSYDDRMHDLLMERTEIVAKVGAAKREKGEAIIRPAREAEIVRRLVGRHTGPFPKSMLVHLWREMLAVWVHTQGPFVMAVLTPEHEAGCLNTARNHFGSHTTTTRHASPSGVVGAVSQGAANVGVLPLPRPGDQAPWWPMIVEQSGETPQIIARLPFAPVTGDRTTDPGPCAQALAIARNVPIEPTGDDRTVLVLESASPASLGWSARVLESAGFTVTETMGGKPLGSEGAWHLAEVAGFVSADDPRLASLAGKGDPPVAMARVLGAYATPLPPEDPWAALENR